MKTITITEDQLAEACAKAIDRANQKSTISFKETILALSLMQEIYEELFEKEGEETEDDISEVLE